MEGSILKISERDYQYLIDEIEKLKFHNRSLLTLIGHLNEEELENTTIHEAVVSFDLSKNDLRELKELIMNYDKNRFAFEQKALLINPVFSRDNLLFIIECFVNSEMFTTMGNEILDDYKKTNN